MVINQIDKLYSNPAQAEVYSIQHYVIKCVSDLWQVSVFLQVLWFPSPKKNDHHDITEILPKVALNTLLSNTVSVTEHFTIR